MGAERRKHKRVFIRFSVEYRGKNIWQKVEAENISEGGIFLITERIEPPGTIVEVIFNFGKKTKKLIYAEGIVAWNREKETVDKDGKVLPPGMGIQFNKYSPLESRTFLAKEVEKWESENGET